MAARTGRRLVTPTLPLLAFSAGRRVDRILTEYLTSVPIEDLPLRFFCVSASLTRTEAVTHESGPLWPAVRASLALPGIYPPIYAAGDLLIDGAAVNNLPVDVMRMRIGSGHVIAVDVSSEVEPLAVVPYGPGLSGWRVLGRLPGPPPAYGARRRPRRPAAPPARRPAARPGLQRRYRAHRRRLPVRG